MKVYQTISQHIIKLKYYNIYIIHPNYLHW